MTHRDLKVWQKSMDLVLYVYRLTRKLPDSEKYGLVSQTNRSAISIPSNIAEGAGRSTPGEYVRFLDIAKGSLSELETQLIIMKELYKCDTESLVENELKIIRVMLTNLQKSILRNSKSKKS
ncbi:four helix bundle protein [Robertkochia sediminum]|uniref:four helix bundle protein n=1 Tax=Robertkochia sediminum TaxID=2785326 RepID=UPI001F31C862|nr:four helix bundle protein [Robertkochia sediminum]MBL7473761.1 four helix bundle protein [Robertkochia sediminum]